ncbi:hypothetical protein [Paracoccus beibuensis]|uniref:hypothetical protein n=1 Tax=Paracoccus beibuensis TaxID=547602 RepID=UPI00223FA256|nr:hypothetical protein [Paracoccus beibuensis]
MALSLRQLLAAAMLMPCPSWPGRVPETEREVLRAAQAEKIGRLCAEDKPFEMAESVQAD